MAAARKRRSGCRVLAENLYGRLARLQDPRTPRKIFQREIPGKRATPLPRITNSSPLLPSLSRTQSLLFLTLFFSPSFSYSCQRNNEGKRASYRCIIRHDPEKYVNEKNTRRETEKKRTSTRSEVDVDFDGVESGQLSGRGRGKVVTTSIIGLEGAALAPAIT